MDLVSKIRKYRLIIQSSLLIVGFRSGYIVGVSNPFFVEKEVYWDVLCDINSGTIKVHNNGFAANITKSLL